MASCSGERVAAVADVAGKNAAQAAVPHGARGRIFTPLAVVSFTAAGSSRAMAFPLASVAQTMPCPSMATAVGPSLGSMMFWVRLPPGSWNCSTLAVAGLATPVILATLSMPWRATHRAPLPSNTPPIGSAKSGLMWRLLSGASVWRLTTVVAWSPCSGSPTISPNVRGEGVTTKVRVAPAGMSAGAPRANGFWANWPQFSGPNTGLRSCRSVAWNVWAKWSSFVTDTVMGRPAVTCRLRADT